MSEHRAFTNEDGDRFYNAYKKGGNSCADLLNKTFPEGLAVISDLPENSDVSSMIRRIVNLERLVGEVVSRHVSDIHATNSRIDSLNRQTEKLRGELAESKRNKISVKEVGEALWAIVENHESYLAEEDR